MTRRTTRSKAARPKSPRRRRRESRHHLVAAGVSALLAVVAFYLLYLDLTVRARFEGRTWDVPARVYGKPLELHPGQGLTADAFEEELRRLGYRPGDRLTRPGFYSRRGAGFLVHVRGFRHAGGKAPPATVRVRFGVGHLASLADARDRELGIVRLEPPLIGRIAGGGEDRILVAPEDVPPFLIRALVATEDRNFASHWGIDPRAIVRAIWANARAGSVVQGGSTLTQQLVKNLYLGPERSLWRKANEALMALLLEWHYDKQAILGGYLNEVYLGQDGGRAIHGFGLASRFWFGRPLNELAVAEQALLVALVRGPSYYDPRRHPERARRRRDLVLELAEREGWLAPWEAERARRAPLGVLERSPTRTENYPAFMDLVRRQLRRHYDTADYAGEGLNVFTTLDLRVQSEAERAVRETLSAIERQRGAARLEGAMVVSDTSSGEVQAVVGGRNPRFAGFNRALDAARPVGSLIKPVVYLTALEEGAHTLATAVQDVPLAVRAHDGSEWRPHNYDRHAHGEVALHLALVHSYNLATVRLGLEVGLGKVVERLRRLGYSPRETYPALLLGAAEMTPWQVAGIYQTLAAAGRPVPLRAVIGVNTADGRRLRRRGSETAGAAASGAAYLVTHAMQAVVAEGTARSLDRFLAERLTPAGKTGTTDDLRDSWFAGFTGDRLAVAWVGRDDNRSAGLTGAGGALRVWESLFRHIGGEPLNPPVPDSIEYRRVAAAVGGGKCRRLRLPFLRGVPPTGTGCAGHAVEEETPGSFWQSLWRN